MRGIMKCCRRFHLRVVVAVGFRKAPLVEVDRWQQWTEYWTYDRANPESTRRMEDMTGTRNCWSQGRRWQPRTAAFVVRHMARLSMAAEWAPRRGTDGKAQKLVEEVEVEASHVGVEGMGNVVVDRSARGG